MVSKKDKKHSGYITPKLTVSIKELEENDLFLNPFYDDWEDWRDGLRDWFGDFKKIKSIPGREHYKELWRKRDLMNKKQKKLTKRRRAKQTFKTIKEANFNILEALHETWLEEKIEELYGRKRPDYFKSCPLCDVRDIFETIVNSKQSSRNFIKLPKQTNYMEKSITFVKITKPAKHDLNDELRWLGASLGLFQLRDKNSSCFRVFIEILKSTKKDKGLTSDEISYRTNLARGTVVHHLNRLISEGIIIHQDKRYSLRSKDLEDVMNQIEQDSLKVIEEMRKIAKEIDNLLNN